MGSVNKAIIVGRVGKDAEIKTFQNGGRIANFSVATSESWKDKASGEKKERVEWHRITVSNDKMIDFVGQYVKKGMQIYVEGQLQTREYEKDGVKKYTTEIVIRAFGGTITLLGSKQDSATDSTVTSAEYKNGKETAATPLDSDNFDSDMPF